MGFAAEQARRVAILGRSARFAQWGRRKYFLERPQNWGNVESLWAGQLANQEIGLLRDVDKVYAELLCFIF